MDAPKKSCPSPEPEPADPEPPSRPEAALPGLVREILLRSPTLSSRNARRILNLGQAAVEPLCAVLVDSKLRDPQGPGGGWAPVHAARLLARLAAGPAIGPLLDVLATTDKLSPLGRAVSKTLAPLKGQLVGPILERLPTAVGAYRHELWYLLTATGVREPRIFDQLLAALTEAPEVGAMCLSEYGDRAALPELSRLLDAHRLGLTDEPGSEQAIFELREAILVLGGQLSATQQAKYERALWTRRVRSAAEVEHAHPSPDTACPCGSGRLYRHCCLQ